MASVFRGSEPEATEGPSQPVSTDGGVRTERPRAVTGLFMGLLVAILLVAASGLLALPVKLGALALLGLGLAGVLVRYYQRWEIREWLDETWWFGRMIFPLLIVGTFVIGVVGGLAAHLQGLSPFASVEFGGSTYMAYKVAPGLLTRELFGATSLVSTGTASVIGAVLYMPTLLEVPIVGDLFGYTQGLMADGPALALLLAGPSLSLPNMIVIWRTIGTKRTSVYVALVVVMATVMGLVWGTVI